MLGLPRLQPDPRQTVKEEKLLRKKQKPSDSAEKLKSNKQLLKQPERVHNNLATKRSLQRKTPMN